MKGRRTGYDQSSHQRYGKIGRATLKIILEQSGLELVAVNDLMPLET